MSIECREVPQPKCGFAQRWHAPLTAVWAQISLNGDVLSCTDRLAPHRLTPPGSHLRPRHAHGRSTWVHCQDIHAHLHHLAPCTPPAPPFSAHSVSRPCGVCFTKRYSPLSILPVALRHGGLICSLGVFKTSGRDASLIPPPLPIPRTRFHVHACVFSARW